MRKSFINKIKREGILYTKNYRYIYLAEENGRVYIKRDKLDTAAVCDKNNRK